MASTTSVSGLVSGIDTASLVSQLMQIEAQPQTLLKTKLTDTQADAAAYRAVNTKFAALQAAAEALTKTTAWAAAKATSSSTAVTATTTSAAASPGSLSFEVKQLASTATFLSGKTWGSTSTAYGSSSITIADADGDTAPVTVSLADGATLADAVKAINAKNAGVTAAVVNTGNGYRLQVTSATSGLDGAFTITSPDLPTFLATAEGRDAELDLGQDVIASSATNTFTDLMPGTTLTVSQTGPATVTVTSDPDAVATAVQSLVTAANAVLTSIDGYTDTTPGSTAVLKGDSTLRALTSKVLTAVSYAVGGDGSASKAGLQLTRDGQIAFDKAAFTAKLKSDPALVQRLVNGTPASTAADGTTVAAVPGVAQRLLAVAKATTDSTAGTLTLLAKSEDTQATGIQDQIDAWDLRLSARQATLTAQFTAMETALGTLKNQASWLSSQIAGLPSWSSSNS